MKPFPLFGKIKFLNPDMKILSSLGKVKIGNQEWLTENYNVDHFRNGDIIPEVKSDEDWGKAGDLRQPAWCYYDNNPENGKKYGKLYNWNAVNDPRGLAPKGWHIPSEKEFRILIEKGTKDGNAFKEVGQGSGNGSGTNKNGFSARLAGYRHFNGWFIDLGDCTHFWSSTENRLHFAANLTLLNWDGYMSLYSDHVRFGYSVRCIRD
jgi:uncharacterized protein (TIGR02145 family)